MAEYDLEFNTPLRYREDAQQWMNYFQRLAQNLGLEVHYRTRATEQGQTEVYTTINGPLPAIQYLDRRIAREAARYAMASGKPKTLQKHVLAPFMEGQRQGVQNITNLVFDVSNHLGAEPAKLSISTDLSQRAAPTKSRTRVDKGIKTIIRAIDGWITGDLSDENAVILCDQGVEDWLKSRLKLPASSRDGFHTVVDKAVDKGIINRMEAYRLRRFHKTRNRVQHRGGRVRPKTVFSMLSYCSRLIDQKTP